MKIKALFICLSIVFTITLNAQDFQTPLTEKEKTEVVDSVSSILNKRYVFPDIATQISNILHKRSKEGVYKEVKDPNEFASILTEDIRSVNNDLHLRVSFSPGMIAEQKNTVTPEDSLAFIKKQQRFGQLSNHGFKEVKILDGNIGYLNLTGFHHVDEFAGATAEAAMNFLSNTDALIIDLRNNGGGSPSMIQLISSYLFDSEPVHLNSFYYRPQDEITQTWTLPYVPGKRRPDVPVYVLTSGQTFSAAEEFSYNLRNLNRATLIGEVTGGGAHPGGTVIATDRFTVWVPSGRAINPVTKTNWEGTGVKPHIEVPAGDALVTAQIKALEKLLMNAPEDDLFKYEWALKGLQSELHPVTLSAEKLKRCAGQYGPRNITYKDGTLFYQRAGNPEHALVAMSEELFRIPEIPYFRLKMIVKNGKVVGLRGLYDNGHTDENLRSEKDDQQP